MSISSPILFSRWSEAINWNLNFLYDRMLLLRGLTIRTLAGCKRMEKRLHRTLQNPSVKPMELTEQAKEYLEQSLANTNHVLLVQDTSDFTFSRENAADMGFINDKTPGLRAHVCIGIDAETTIPLGVLSLNFFNRVSPKSKLINGKAPEPAEERESYRWIETLNQAATLQYKGLKTIVGDRESDMYLLFTKDRHENCHLLVRSSRNRKVANGESLVDCLMKQKSHIVKKDIPEGSHSSRLRKATFEIRWAEVEIKKPKDCVAEKKSIKVYCLNVLEVTQGVAEPIHWRLLTTHSIKDVVQAERIIEWYRQRWTIEELFRTTKKQGLQAEASQLQNIDSLQNLLSICFLVAVRCLQLTRIRGKEELSDIKASITFNSEDLEFAEIVNRTCEGQTQKQKNPYPIGSFHRIAWVISRLGGWNGYPSDRRPGVITFSRGLRIFYQTKIGWNLALGLR